VPRTKRRVLVRPNRRACPGWVQELAALVVRDPGGRGIAQLLLDGQLVVAEELYAAGSLLAGDPGEIILVTGFPVLTEDGPRPETDGPPGAVLLGATLCELGWQVTIATDTLHVDTVRAIVGAVGAKGVSVRECTAEDVSPPWSLRPSAEATPTRVLIAVERPGPAYRTAPEREGSSADPVFDEVVPAEHRGQLHGFRGNIITPYCAPLHEWFLSRRGDGVTTVGVGDGGNEVGFGRIPWRVIHTTIDGRTGGLIACSIPTDHLIVAGVSNWGAYALGLCAVRLADRVSAARWITPAADETAVRAAVAAGGVDGVTARPEALVDGLPPEVHAEFVAGARRAVGLD